MRPAQILTKAVRDYLTAKGWFVWKGGGGAWGTNGAPDLFAIKNQLLVYELKTKERCLECEGSFVDMKQPAFFALEIKAGHDRQSKAQEEFQKDFEAHGGTYIIVRKTEDLDEYI